MMAAATTMVDSSEKTRLSVSETIQEIKDAVGNHSEEDILIVLKETNMDANEAVHKLLYQDSFHEVKRKRDKKKEIPVIKRSSEPRMFTEPNTGFKGSSEPRKVTEQNTAFKRSSEPSKPTEQTHGLRPRTFSERSVRRQGYSRGSFPDAGTSRQFRVVRDNRVNQNTNREAAVQSTTSASGQGTPAIPPRSQVRILTDQRHTGPRNSEGQRSSQTGNGPSDSGRGQYKDTNSSSNNRKGVSDENRAKAPTASASQGPRPRSSNSASNNTVVGLYSSSSDPVHVPSNSRPSGNRHAVGVVGYPRKSSDNSKQHSTVPSSSTKETSSVSQPPPPSGSTTIKSNHHAHPPTSDSAVTNTKSFTNKPHQLPTGHQKAPHGNRKWKPKPSSIGTSTTVSVPPPVDHSVEKEAEHLENQMSQVSINEYEHVFIPQHLRVPEADRTHLTFGSFGIVDINSTNLENEPQSSEEDVVINQLESDSLNGQSGNSESASPASENPSADVKESSSPNLETYADMGIVRNNSPPYAPAQPQQLQLQQQQQDAPLPSYVTYDSQPGYDMPFYRPMTDESLRSHQSVPSPVEALSSHVPNSIPPSSLAIPQLYPQVHVSHFPGYMPYRQFIPSMYVPPPMGVPGYTNNPGYPHPQNGGGYMLMPGGSSHMSAAAAASGLKYGPASQYKPIPAGTPTGFGNYPSPTGYAINTQGAPIGGANGLDDSTRMKFKDGNLYVPNPQAETSEIWIQTPREIPGMQSSPYYNIPGQAPHPAAYMTSHPGHASFNGAAAVQPTHMQYPGLYHPSPQQAGIANQHHMVQNVGVAGAAPGGAQIGAYQQPQLGHLNWNTNF